MEVTVHLNFRVHMSHLGQGKPSHKKTFGDGIKLHSPLQLYSAENVKSFLNAMLHKEIVIFRPTSDFHTLKDVEYFLNLRRGKEVCGRRQPSSWPALSTRQVPQFKILQQAFLEVWI